MHSGLEHEIGCGLNDALKEIARAPQLLSSIAGPNSWDAISPSDFGPEEDFRVHNGNHCHYCGWMVVFIPVSEAALQWCYSHLPSDCPRWGTRGFVIEPHYINAVVKAARRDRLMSLEDYTEAMNENNQLQFAHAEQQEI